MNIAIVSVNKKKYSETFIHAQVKKLPASVYYLHTGYLPTMAGFNDIPLVPPSLITTFKKWRGHSEDDLLQFAIKKYLRRNGIQLVLAQYGPSGVKMMEICHELNLPLFVYFRGYDAYRREILESYGTGYSRLFDIAVKLFVVSHEMKAQLVYLGADEQKIIYNPSGADTEQFIWHDAGKNPLKFLTVGRFEETKNHQATIQAFQQVVKNYPHARLILVGDGPLKKTCIDLVKALNLESAVEFAGILPHESVADIMAQVRCFALHSFTPVSGDKEGTPVSIMEACASGLPVVATHHGGIPDVVKDGETGFLVKEGDIRNMADRMVRLAADPNLATRLGTAGHHRIRNHFTQKQNIDLLWASIQESVCGSS